MTPNARDVLATALQLPEEDRAAVAEELLASFDPELGKSDPTDDVELLAELDRRAEELRRNPSAGLPWDVVKELR
jgi:putative addiction module component (TIGR02574 family)